MITDPTNPQGGATGSPVEPGWQLLRYDEAGLAGTQLRLIVDLLASDSGGVQDVLIGHDPPDRNHEQHNAISGLGAGKALGDYVSG